MNDGTSHLNQFHHHSIGFKQEPTIIELCMLAVVCALTIEHYLKKYGYQCYKNIEVLVTLYLLKASKNKS